MPNVVVEYSANIAADADIPGLCGAIARTIIASGLVPTAGIRVRAYSCDDYVIADGKREYAFVSLTARLARGRPEEDVRRCFDAVFRAVKAHLEPVDKKWLLALSMDVEAHGDRIAYKQNRIHELFGTQPFASFAS
jgi:5-carboxymethyl-2-hydroxymuconate isomerase